MSKTNEASAVLMPSVEDDKRVLAAARSDPDAQPLTSAQLKAMVPLKKVLGRPVTGNRKVLLSVRYSAEVVAFFKSTGDGWQTRMDGVLREYVEKHSRG